jgi:hypothetical protein
MVKHLQVREGEVTRNMIQGRKIAVVTSKTPKVFAYNTFMSKCRNSKTQISLTSLPC